MLLKLQFLILDVSVGGNFLIHHFIFRKHSLKLLGAYFHISNMQTCSRVSENGYLHNYNKTHFHKNRYQAEPEF